MKILTVLINQHYRDKVTLRENKLKKRHAWTLKMGKQGLAISLSPITSFF